VPGWAPSPPEDGGASYDVHEKTRTYWKFERFSRNCMLLMIRDLYDFDRFGPGKRGFKK
jgi:hypothetical protein